MDRTPTAEHAAPAESAPDGKQRGLSHAIFDPAPIVDEVTSLFGKRNASGWPDVEDRAAPPELQTNVVATIRPVSRNTRILRTDQALSARRYQTLAKLVVAAVVECLRVNQGAGGRGASRG